MARKILAVKFIEMEEAKTGRKIAVIFLTDLTTVSLENDAKSEKLY